MLNDLRSAFRTLRRNPRFTIVAILTLALGIGANTALFTIADAVLFKPLPYPALERIVKIEAAPLSLTRTGFTAPRAMEDSPVFAGSGIYISGGINVGGEPRAERVRAAAVSAGFFPAPAGVLRETMRGGLWYAVPGIAVGTVMAAVLLRVVISRVPGLHQADGATLALSAAGMLCVAVFATWIPARRAGRIYPVVALRGE